MDIDGAALHAKGAYIARCLYQTCIRPDGGERFRRTGSLSPATSLKQKKGRKAFEWASDVGGGKKFYTLAACRLAVEMLLEDKQLVVPLVGLSHHTWVESQARTVMRLAQRSRKNSGASLRFLGYRQSKLMDWQETLELDQVGCSVNANRSQHL